LCPGEQALKQTERKAQQYNPLTDEQQEAFAERFFKLAQRLQAKPEYQHGVRYLLEQLRTTMEKGGIHAERMQEQLRGAWALA
jgi:trehalose/maltose hydrolase-like predicted phosphorylase